MRRLRADDPPRADARASAPGAVLPLATTTTENLLLGTVDSSATTKRDVAARRSEPAPSAAAAAASSSRRHDALVALAPRGDENNNKISRVPPNTVDEARRRDAAERAARAKHSRDVAARILAETEAKKRARKDRARALCSAAAADVANARIAVAAEARAREDAAVAREATETLWALEADYAASARTTREQLAEARLARAYARAQIEACEGRRCDLCDRGELHGARECGILRKRGGGTAGGGGADSADATSTSIATSATSSTAVDVAPPEILARGALLRCHGDVEVEDWARWTPREAKIAFDELPLSRKGLSALPNLSLFRGGETASHTTPFAWCTPFLKDFSRRHSSPALPFQHLTGKTFD